MVSGRIRANAFGGAVQGFGEFWALEGRVQLGTEARANTLESRVQGVGGF